jgi:IMP dehydrogenase
MRKKNGIDVTEVYKEMYPQSFAGGSFFPPIPSYSLNEILLRPVFSNYSPDQVDLSTSIGHVKLRIPLLSAAMDTVTGPHMAKALSNYGGCGVIYRHRRADTQIEWIKEALSYSHCLVHSPKILGPDEPLEEVKRILEAYGYSTIPVVKENILMGVLFADDIVFKDNLTKPVKKFMKPYRMLKLENIETSFEKIRDRLFYEEECSMLPVVDGQRRLKGIYFKKDFFHVNPSSYNGRPLVGMAVGTSKEDMERVKESLKLGIGIIVIDSSHGNCPPVIEQAKKIVKIVKDRAVIVAGNIADIDGYLRLAEVGVHGVKFGIGGGSICTTSSVTGAGAGMFTLTRELSYMRRKMISKGMRVPSLIADGSISGPGRMVTALAAGADVCMSGEWLVAAHESISFQEGYVRDDEVLYRGMASEGAIKARSSERYGKSKSAPEGVEGYVKIRGLLGKFLKKDLELVRGGFAHAGAGNIEEFHIFGDLPFAFGHISEAGQLQVATRVKEV